MTILKETDWYQEILKEGVKEGRREGVAEGRRAVEESLLLVLTSRLGEVPADVKSALDRLNLAQLQTVFRAVLDVETWDEVRAALPERI